MSFKKVIHALALYLVGKENDLDWDFGDAMVSLRNWDKSLIDDCLATNNMRFRTETSEEYAARGGTKNFDLCPFNPDLISKKVTGHGHIYMLYGIVDGIIQLYVGLNAIPSSGTQIGARCHKSKGIHDSTAWGGLLDKLKMEGVNVDEQELYEDFVFYCGGSAASNFVMKKKIESSAILAAAFNTGGRMTHDGKDYPFNLRNHSVNIPYMTNDLWSVVTCVSKKLFNTRFVLNQTADTTVCIPVNTQCVSQALKAIHFQ